MKIIIPNPYLRLAILRSGKRQYEVAKDAGLTETALSRILLGRREASPQVRQRLAKILEATEQELFPPTGGGR